MNTGSLLQASDNHPRGFAISRSLRPLSAPVLLVAASLAIAAAVSTGGVAALGVGVIDGAWTTGASMPTARRASASASLNGILYVAGGIDGGAMTSQMYAYDPATNAWSSRMAMPGPRYWGNGAVAMNGKLYVAGGWTNNPSWPLPNSNLWEYDPAANTWSTKASMPILSACGASAAINGKLYVTTACDGYSGYRNYLHVWDPANDTWTQLAGSASAHAGGPAIGVINGKLYLGGGVDSADAVTGLFEVYDPASNSWATLASMPTPRADTASVVLNGKLYVAGGRTASGVASSVVESYDPQSSSWSTVASLPTARSQAAAGVIGNVAYVAGGYDGTAAVTVTEALELSGTAGTGTLSGTGTLVAPGNYKHNYTFVTIDAGSVAPAGVIDIKITLGNGTSSASYDLYPASYTPVSTGYPQNSLAHAYDYSPGSVATMSYSFGPETSKEFKLGLEGNWSSPEGSSNTFAYEITIVGSDTTGATTTTSTSTATTTTAGSTTTTTLAGTSTATLSFTPGWNLVGNSASGTLDVAATFGDATKATTVWKWIASTSRWAFYTPTFGDGGAAYASSKGYDHLTSIGGGEGFWVNAKDNFSAQLPAGSAIASASFQGIAAGWNLIAVGDNPTPSGFNKQLSLTPPAAGDIPLNVTTLWAWDSSLMNWYFYAPSLEKSATLASYIASKSYLDFGSRTLDATTGFWVNVPAGGSGTTTTASTTSTTAATTTSTTAATTTSTTSTSTTSSTTTTTTAAVTTTTINAPPCVYAINPAGATFGAEGGNNWFAVTATTSPCLIQEWAPAANQAWITNVYKYAMNIGNGYVNLQVLPNTSTVARNGGITITWPGNAVGVTYAVTQAGANQFQGTVYGTWGGTCNFDFGPVSASGTFAMTIDANGGVSGTYSGLESGMITGSVNPGSGGLSATTSGAGNGGISWGGTFSANPLRGNGSWTDSGFCSGTWSTN